MLSNALGDPVSGFTGAAAILAALHARQHDGRGRLVECAQLEGFLPFVSEALISYRHAGEQPPRRANRRPGHTPSAAFRCGNGDDWLALEVRTDAEWAALASIIQELWALDPALSNEAGRAASGDLHANLSAWFATRDRDTTVEQLLAAGVPAAPVLTEPGVLALEPLAASGYWAGEDREPVGFHFYPSLPIIAAGTHLNAEGPAPLLGQHTAEVLHGMGLDDSALHALELSGVTGRTPIAAP
ncbi:MAG TPA: CoA transferase, partial [Tepidiformaceae bacterium]|nr:CoA transferase [Tepidiformaceae bacterium]